MSENTQTETEQLIDDMTDKQSEESTEQDEQEQDDEEITTEDELEAEREIAEYHTKIEQLDDRLAELKADKLTAMRRREMEKRSYSPEQIDRYVRFIEGETEEEVSLSVMRFDIPASNSNYIDPTPMSGGSGRPRPRDGAEVGRSAIRRVIDKIRL